MLVYIPKYYKNKLLKSIDTAYIKVYNVIKRSDKNKRSDEKMKTIKNDILMEMNDLLHEPPYKNQSRLCYLEHLLDGMEENRYGEADAVVMYAGGFDPRKSLANQ